jgi:hypothetical protein
VGSWLSPVLGGVDRSAFSADARLTNARSPSREVRSLRALGSTLPSSLSARRDQCLASSQLKRCALALPAEPTALATMEDVRTTGVILWNLVPSVPSSISVRQIFTIRRESRRGKFEASGRRLRLAPLGQAGRSAAETTRGMLPRPSGRSKESRCWIARTSLRSGDARYRVSAWRRPARRSKQPSHARLPGPPYEPRG